jgi:hypothetical protein
VTALDQPTPVRARDLLPGQLNGLACCWCAHPLTVRECQDEPVGQISDGTPLRGCRACLKAGRRLPTFGEFGAV